MYRTPALSVARAGVSAGRRGREALVLRFATIRVNQFGSRARWESDVRPILSRIARLEWWPDHAGGHELVETACPAAFRVGSRRNKLRDDPSVRGDRDPLASFDSADVATEIVFQIANAG